MRRARPRSKGGGTGRLLEAPLPEAERHFQAAVDADPGSAAALYYPGYTVYKIAEPKRPNDPGKRRAAELFARAYQIDPGFGRAGAPEDVRSGEPGGARAAAVLAALWTLLAPAWSFAADDPRSPNAPAW